MQMGLISDFEVKYCSSRKEYFWHMKLFLILKYDTEFSKYQRYGEHKNNVSRCALNFIKTLSFSID